MSNARIEYPIFNKVAAEAREGLLAMGRAAAESGLDHELGELIKLRVSQLNGCAFCLQMHINELRKSGAAQARIDLLAAWHEVTVYSEKERAALGWAEALTRFGGHEAIETAWKALQAHFSEEEAVFLTVAIANINAWNRISVGLNFTPQPAV